MRPDELERRLLERLDALGPAPSAELLHVLMPLARQDWSSIPPSHRDDHAVGFPDA
ncbi:MAG TPA: hypothetical protein VJW23_07445 [Propionibacteriaceae bacterium]|nr:hypothetical protein [Propionibacteriaceae bacterium]